MAYRTKRPKGFLWKARSLNAIVLLKQQKSNLLYFVNQFYVSQVGKTQLRTCAKLKLCNAATAKVSVKP